MVLVPVSRWTLVLIDQGMWGLKANFLNSSSAALKTSRNHSKNDQKVIETSFFLQHIMQCVKKLCLLNLGVQGGSIMHFSALISRQHTWHYDWHFTCFAITGLHCNPLCLIITPTTDDRISPCLKEFFCVQWDPELVILPQKKQSISLCAEMTSNKILFIYKLNMHIYK